MDCISKNEAYSEGVGYANHYRVQQYREICAFIESMRERADEKRAGYFKPDCSSPCNFAADIERYRKDFMQMLGYPDCMYEECRRIPDAEVSFVAEDGYGKIYRVRIFISENLSAYGLLFTPLSNAPYPLVIAQHGGSGTPEKCSGLNGPSAYNGMVRRVLRRGVAVYAPQLMTWGVNEHGPDYTRMETDNRLKQMGSSFAALEIYKLMRSLDYLLARDDIDEGKVGMMGVSYGGFYALYAAAADTRIKAALASCSFNSRYEYCSQDMTWTGSAQKFLDAEVCALVCPRSLYLEVGRYDTVFDWNLAVKEYERAAQYYRSAGFAERLAFHIHPYAHVFDLSDAGIDFLLSGMLAGQE